MSCKEISEGEETTSGTGIGGLETILTEFVSSVEGRVAKKDDAGTVEDSDGIFIEFEVTEGDKGTDNVEETAMGVCEMRGGGKRPPEELITADGTEGKV